MNIFGANITQSVSDYLNTNLKNHTTFENANQMFYDDFGIIQFLNSDDDLALLKNDESFFIVPDRTAYGDFQTNENLANSIVQHLVDKNINPEIVIEPTCGKGNFIIAALKNFKTIKYICGVEIYAPYIWQTKFNIIDFYLNNQVKKTHQLPDILINHCDVFDFDFKAISKQYTQAEILIIGNPPWVTNSKLSSLNSDNLPRKTNFKNHSGLDAMTGKGNFDIAEFITMTMINTFQNMKGSLLLLVKNAVIKNIVFEQKKRNFLISDLQKLCIDSKKEFNVSVEAALFYCKLQTPAKFECTEFDFYTSVFKSKFGWLNDKFVSNIELYAETKAVDGVCPFVWRQGLKHDCSAIMDLEKQNGHYVNALNEHIKLEEKLVYGMLKSSDLKNTVIEKPRKYTIVTQKKVGQETTFIKDDYPQTYQYLMSHQSNFEARKSSIYNNKPAFSIFGIGDYSFKPFKVAISGLYKTFHFTLVLPQNQKPVMLDDTCYLIGFDKIEFAIYALILLNSNTTKQFLQSVTFSDAKRVFTKDVLMRIDMLELANRIDTNYLEIELDRLNKMYHFDLTLCFWTEFINEMKPINQHQTVLFP